MGTNDIHPPSNYHDIDLRTVNLQKGNVLFRCSNSAHGKDGAIYFVKDTPEDKTRSGRYGDLNMSVGVCYFGESFDASIVETLLQSDGHVKVMPEADIEAKAISQVEIKSDLTLVQFYGSGLYHNQADAAVTTQNHMSSRLWSTQIINHPNNYDGIIWRSVINDDLMSVVIFESAKAKLDIKNALFINHLNSKNIINDVADVLALHSVDIV